VAEIDSRGLLTNLTRRTRDSSAVDAVHVPPHSIEAEQAVLGGLMLDNSTWDAIADRLVAEDFYRRDHQLTFAAIAELTGRNEPCDAVTLSQFLDRQGQGGNGRPKLSRYIGEQHP
jgi:replicative DNA helicase